MSPAPGSATSAMRSRRYAEEHHFSVVREFCGHGIGGVFTRSRRCCTSGAPPASTRGRHDLHGRTDDQRRPRDVKLLPDHWTVVTKDHKLSAQWEHTVLVTEDGQRGPDLEPAPTAAPDVDDQSRAQRRSSAHRPRRARAGAARRRHGRQGVPRCAEGRERPARASGFAATRPSRRSCGDRAHVVDDVILASWRHFAEKRPRLRGPRRRRRLRPRRAASAIRHRSARFCIDERLEQDATTRSAGS